MLENLKRQQNSKKIVPFGMIPEGKLRFGSLPIRKRKFLACGRFRRKLLLFLIVYILIGIT